MRKNLNLSSKGEKAPNFLKNPIFRNESGTTAIFVAICLFMLLIVLGIVIDLGHLYVVRQELQNAADAGADAGAMSLYWLANGTNPKDAKDLLNCAYAQLKAMEVVQHNKSDKKLLLISNADIEVGVWQYNPAGNSWEFQELPCDAANAYTLNAVRVTTRRTNAWNGPVNLFFGGILGFDSVELTAQATAMLGWVRHLRPGGGFPIAVGENYVPPPGQKMPVTFKNDWSDTGCWHTFKHPYPDADYIEDLVTGDWKDNGIDPQDLDIKIGDNIMLKNGVATSVLKETANQFYNVHNGDWTVCVPVVNTSQFNQNKEVRGFVAFEITEVDEKEKTVSGWIRGGYVAPGTDTGSPSGGSELALRASLPKLVQ
jgi:Flp pilus assembly protein TadG